MPLLVSDYLNKKAAMKKIPLNGVFELSPVCNFSCKMCYVRKTPEQIRQSGKQIIEWTDWLKLGEECKDAGMLYLLLTGGEPFLYPHFRELYEKLHHMNILLSINTNGTMITDDVIGWLKQKAPSRVNITLYGASSETYGRICGNPAGYDRAVHAILGLKEAGIPVVINASMIPENVADLKAIVDFGKQYNINTRVATYMFPPVRRDKETSDSRFTPEQAAEYHLLNRFYHMGENQFCKYVTDSLKTIQSAEKIQEENDNWGTDEEFMKCRAGRSSFWVSWDGTMNACGLMPFPVEVYPFKENFKDCWMKITNAVRSTNVMQECSGCKYKELCRPCAAMLYAETGDVTKKAPYMCQMAKCIYERMREYEKNYL